MILYKLCACSGVCGWFWSQCTERIAFNLSQWVFSAGGLNGFPQYLVICLQAGDASDLQVLARLSECNVYTALNARVHFCAPTEFALCLTGEREALRCLACESERARTCWLTAMRLAKVSQYYSLHTVPTIRRPWFRYFVSPTFTAPLQSTVLFTRMLVAITAW